MQNFPEQLNADMSALVQNVRASLVQIRNGHKGTGAGTIWHGKGLIVTNAHVVGEGSVEVTLPDGTIRPARVLTKDRQRDLAALVVDGDNLPTIELGDSRNLKPGQWVVAMGHPWGVKGAVSAGIVIGLGPAWIESETHQRDYILVSLHLRPGHSGGPLVDCGGRLVGINTMINGPDVGIAIPVHEIKTFLRESLRT